MSLNPQMFTSMCICFFPLSILFFATRFYRKQNTGADVGGDISFTKALWLSQAIHSWFFLPFFILTFTDSTLIQLILSLHLLSWWIRGPLELVMIYKWFNWSPRYGIAHDVAHLLFLLSAFSYACFNLYGLDFIFSIWALIFIGFLALSTLFELIFAIFFLKIRGEEKHKIYFANNSKEWRLVNMITHLGNISVLIFYSAQTYFFITNYLIKL